MAKFDLNAKYEMLSVYEIPVLGYGVWLCSLCCCFGMSTQLWNS